MEKTNTFSSSRRLGYPNCPVPTFFFSMIRGQKHLTLICFGIALQMADTISSWSNRGVEVGGIDDVRLWKPVTGVSQLRTGLY